MITLTLNTSVWLPVVIDSDIVRSDEIIIPSGFTGRVVNNYVETSWSGWNPGQGKQVIIQHDEEYFYKEGKLHREGGLPASRKSYWYVTGGPKMRQTTTNYYLDGKRVTKQVSKTAATNPTRVFLSLNGHISIGEELSAWGLSGTVYGLQVGSEKFVLDEADSPSGAVTHRTRQLFDKEDNAQKKTQVELVKMFHELFSTMCVVG